MGKASKPLTILVVDPDGYPDGYNDPAVRHLKAKGHTVVYIPLIDYDVIWGYKAWRRVPVVPDMATKVADLMVQGVRAVKYPKGK